MVKGGMSCGIKKRPLIRYAGSAGRNLDWFKTDR